MPQTESKPDSGAQQAAEHVAGAHNSMHLALFDFVVEAS